MMEESLVMVTAGTMLPTFLQLQLQHSRVTSRSWIQWNAGSSIMYIPISIPTTPYPSILVQVNIDSTMGGFVVVILAIISLGLGSASWFLTPKGVNQT